MNVKVGDFGFCRRAQSNALLKTPCGSPDYVAPEILQGSEYDGTKADIWSLGVVLFIFETGKLPWTATNGFQLFQQISNGEYEVPVTIDEDMADLISSCLRHSPDDRPSAAKILESPLFREFAASVRTQTRRIRSERSTFGASAHRILEGSKSSGVIRPLVFKPKQRDLDDTTETGPVLRRKRGFTSLG
jgi:serine/threonine protein kinase